MSPEPTPGSRRAPTPPTAGTRAGASPSRWPGWVRALVAVLAGVGAGLGQAPTSWWWLALPAVAVLTVLARSVGPRAAAGLGFLFGLGMFGVAIGWVHVVAWPLPLVLTPVMAGWSALTGWGLRLVRDLPGASLWGACVWTAAELVAARWPLGGFGWVRLAWAAVDSPFAGLLRWIGAVGVSLVLAWVAQLLADLVTSTRRLRTAVVLTAAVALAAGVGLATTHRGNPRPGPGHPGVHVMIVQGGVDGTAGPHAMGYARSVTENHLSETILALADQRAHGQPAPDMVLWPENSSDVDPTLDAQTHDLITAALRLADRPVLVGAVTDGPGPDERQTTAQWWPADADGPTATYQKRNLVPFGEWIPWRRQLLPLIPMLSQVGRQSVPGTGPGVLDVEVAGRRTVIGDVICFELAWDSTVHETVTSGAQLLVVQSNNATYTHTGQPLQQWQITRARAIETGRPVVVATTSSFSGLVEPSGRVTTRTEEATHAHRLVEVPLTRGVSAGVALTPALTAGVLIAAGVALAWSVVLRWRDRRAPRPVGRVSTR